MSPAPFLLWIFKTSAGVHSYTPALVHHCPPPMNTVPTVKTVFSRKVAHLLNNNALIHSWPWASEGRPFPAEFWIFQQKKVVFLVSSGKKQISPLLFPSRKILEKSPSGHPLDKNSCDAYVPGWKEGYKSCTCAVHNCKFWLTQVVFSARLSNDSIRRNKQALDVQLRS